MTEANKCNEEWNVILDDLLSLESNDIIEEISSGKFLSENYLFYLY